MGKVQIKVEPVGKFFERARELARRAAMKELLNAKIKRRESNPRYYALIEAFRALTGVPMVLNTSFNENEPVVCRPEEALDCFLRTKMDVLVMGEWVVERKG